MSVRAAASAATAPKAAAAALATGARLAATPSMTTRSAPTPLQRKCACGSTAATIDPCPECGRHRLQNVQRRLAVGAADDAYEREADRVADAVLRAPVGARGVAGAISHLVQRSAPAPERDHGSGGAAREAPGAVHAVLASSGRPLDHATRAYFEPRFNHDFAHVRVHDDAAAAASARAVRAHAYTVGAHVVFDRGRYAPHGAAGRRLLAHELTHVVQQRGGAALQRASISAPVTGHLGGEADEPRHPDAQEPRGDDEELPVQRLQRRVAIVGFDEAGPNADLSGEREDQQLKRIGECLKGKGPDPDECTPSAALTWADFTAAPNLASQFGAVTASTIKTKDVPSQKCVEEVVGRPTGPMRIFQGVFDPTKSWVKPKPKNAADPAQNGSANLAQKCRSDWDAAVAKGLTGITWKLSTSPDPQCAASPRPAGTPATTKAECSTTIVTDYTAQAVADSARLLNHEQYHFKLTCAMAKKGNAVLWRGGSFDAVDKVILKTLAATQKLYDDESHHGCDAAAQATWQSEIDKGLPKVQLP